MQPTRFSPLMAAVGIVFLLLTPTRAVAHCDGLDGPVVKAARYALETREPAHVLIWVQEVDEPAIRQAFEQTLAVRALGTQARELADRFFFETVVRLHRAGEGAPFTGLKPAGLDLGPAIPAADEAIRTGSAEPLRHLLTAAIQDRLREQFRSVMTARQFGPHDVAGGRAYVKAYVEFIHFVEILYDSAIKPPHGHFESREPATKHH